MSESLFAEMKRHHDFGPADEANVRSLATVVLPAVPMIVDRFYSTLLRLEGTRAILSRDGVDHDALRTTQSTWLKELFEGDYGDAYFARRVRIGRAHVQVGMPQHYMLGAMELIWRTICDVLDKADIADQVAKRRSLHKLLMLELAVMLESYKESFAEQVRVTERSAVEEKLTRAEHLAEIGQLAASLAHEIKNPLAGISGAIQVMRDAMEPQNPHQPIVTEILGQIRRLDATVKDLLQYARPTPPRVTQFRIGDTVMRVLALLREEPALQDVSIEQDGSGSDTIVRADDAQIEQLLINLLINAAHASSAGDKIKLSIERDGPFVRLIVADQGAGMTRAVRDQAFEAFFTTKAKGTGLGLSICRRIVEVHGGRIRLESELTRGTTVTVDLPVELSEVTASTQS